MKITGTKEQWQSIIEGQQKTVAKPLLIIANNIS